MKDTRPAMWIAIANAIGRVQKASVSLVAAHAEMATAVQRLRWLWDAYPPGVPQTTKRPTKRKPAKRKRKR